ncbi:hypothetical protein TRVL_10347 [Trypanosoma vivax]|nr:hypothetical protein TRVL_10347 [Trypanosoma vivax]
MNWYLCAVVLLLRLLKDRINGTTRCNWPDACNCRISGDEKPHHDKTFDQSKNISCQFGTYVGRAQVPLKLFDDLAQSVRGFTYRGRPDARELVRAPACKTEIMLGTINFRTSSTIPEFLGTLPLTRMPSQFIRCMKYMKCAKRKQLKKGFHFYPDRRVAMWLPIRICMIGGK